MDNRVEILVNAIDRLRDLSHTREDLIAVKTALDSIFMSNGKCKNFVYTVNNDKLPFGCVVMPVLSDGDISNFLVLGSPIKLTDYEIELDSKVFDYGLSNESVACILIYNIYHLIADATPSNRVREFIDSYLTDNDVNIIIKDSIQYQAILAFGLYDALNQMVNCLNLPDDVESDAYLDSLGIGDEFIPGINKLYKEIPGCENEITRQPNLSMLYWTLRLYHDVAKERIPAIHVINRVKQLTASVLYINRMNAVLNALNRVDTDYMISESAGTGVLNERTKGFLAAIRYSGLRDIENDLYTYITMARNATSEADVYYLLKQINARLTILDDYIRENQNDPDIDRWVNLKMQYCDIRDKVAKTKLYKSRNYSVFVDYDKIDKDENHDYNYDYD